MTHATLRRSATIFGALALGAVASAQTATLLDGTPLTQKQPLELFATEGPIWNLSVERQQIEVVGKTLTFPQFVNGVELLISGSSVLGQDGEALTGIGAASFDRLTDSRAIGADADPAPAGAGLGPLRLGPVRSIFSTSEARRNEANLTTLGLVRDASAQTVIEQNYFNAVSAAYPAHAAVLPPNFLELAGLPGTARGEATYPVTAGGTLKSAGHVYVDALGNEYFVPDIEAVIELSENVSGGILDSIAPGNGTVPDSFVIGDLLLIFNQDPRFGADVLGFGETPIPREEFFNQAIVGSTPVDVIGHMVGEHVMFVQEILTEFTDPNAGITITADRIQFRADRGEIRWRGTVDKPAGINLVAVLGTQEFNIPLTVDAITGGATYTARFRNLLGLDQLEKIVMEARDANGVVQASEEFLSVLFEAR